MSFRIRFEDKALNDFDTFAKSGNKAVLAKIQKLLKELEQHPLEGTGRPKALKHNLSGLWSRRINREHRLIYEVEGNTVSVFSAYGHYES